MEFEKLKGYWTKATAEKDDVMNASSMTNRNANNNNNDSARLEGLDEIKPEITEEGYGLRTPYGTHLNLDFVKFCEDLASGQHLKRTYTKPVRHRTRSSTTSGRQKQRYGQHRLSSDQSSDSFDFSFADELIMMGQEDTNAENTLMETRRRLEAFRSFRSKRHKSSAETILSPPHQVHPNRIGYGAGRGPHGPTASNRNGQATGNNRNGGNISPCSSSSESTSHSGMGSLPPGSQFTPQHLQVVREQMASALVRLKELEEQVKTIPLLQVKISVLQQEKKHLLEELKLRNEDASPSNSGTSQAIKTPRKITPSTTSSGVSSLSSFSSPQSTSMNSESKPLLRKSLSNDSYRQPNVEVPPSPPKRKYRSLAVGDDVPLDDIICYHKGYNSASQPIYKPPRRKESVDFSSIVKQIDIDAAFDIFPPPQKELMDAETSTDTFEMKSTSFQTDCLKTKDSSMQTYNPTYATVGCGSTAPRTRDNYCTPVPPNVRHISTMTIPVQKQTNDFATSSSDLIKLAHKQVGPKVDTATASVGTDLISSRSEHTSCEGLIMQKDAKSGVDEKTTFKDAAVTTDTTFTKDVASSCELPSKNSKLFADKNTMTLDLQGRWISYVNMATVACGDDCDIALRIASTNTEPRTISHQSTETISVKFADKTTQSKLSPLSSNVSTNTSPVLKYNRSTDCSEIQPDLRHNSSNTIALKTNSVSTQYAINRSNIVDCMVNTDIVKTSHAQTSTDDLVVSKNIDVYVDKVQSLLEEQQSLLAENYKVFTEEWDGKTEKVFSEELDGKTQKVSRFINPVFAETDDSKAEETDPPTPNAIEASFSLISKAERKDSSSSMDESDTDSSEDEATHSPHRPLPSLDIDVKLKSIMKKPGTPSGVKKSLRFAEGVKSDDDSSSCSSDSESSDEEEEKEHDNAKKNEDNEHEINEKQQEVISFSSSESESSDSEEEVKEDSKPPEKNEFNYSIEFVKKSSEVENTTVSIPIEEQVLTEKNEPKLEEEEIEISVEDPTFEILHGEENDGPAIQPLKYIFTTQVLDACDILEKHLRNPKSIDKPSLAFATSIVQQEWFRVAAQPDSSKDLLDDFVTDLADTSLPVLRKVVNMTDHSGNTVLHYAISHGNITVVESLLSIEELDVNRTNLVGYTSAMLAALCDVTSDLERRVFKKLFSISDINIHAKEAGQTALMLAVSHGRVQTAQLLINAGAEINAKDEDGSTALMCAVEHNQLEAVKLLLSKPTCDPTIADTDGSTALNIAMDAGRNDIAILLYAQVNFRSTTKAPKPRVACKSMIPSPIPKPIKS